MEAARWRQGACVSRGSLGGRRGGAERKAVPWRRWTMPGAPVRGAAHLPLTSYGAISCVGCRGRRVPKTILRGCRGRSPTSPAQRRTSRRGYRARMPPPVTSHGTISRGLPESLGERSLSCVGAEVALRSVYHPLLKDHVELNLSGAAVLKDHARCPYLGYNV